LPGLDFGDSASFQTGVGSLTLTPRQAYPLYYALGNVFAWLDSHEPAHAMNLASAVYGSLAVGIATWLAAELTASTLGGIAAGFFLAFSYTFWSQAITAEVYTLHLLIVGLALLALLEWEKRPSLARLAVFYGIYALGFGNHLSMILLLPGFILFLLMQRRPHQGDPLAPRAVVMAIAIAMAGALQYIWNFRGLWVDLEPPESLGQAIGKFWFDVTKADWRETLVMGVSEAGLRGRPAMYWWDLQQQFGVPGIVLAVIGFGYLMCRWPRRGILLLTLYLTALAFAWTYNVGDAYIFFLPSHYIIALCAGTGVAALLWLTSAVSPQASVLSYLVGVLCLLYPSWRAYDGFPALDRSWDRRAVQAFDRLSGPPTSNRKWFCADAIFGLDANWQVQNAAEYYMREHKPAAAWFVTDELMWLTPENRGGFSRFAAHNRPVVVTEDARQKIVKADPEGNSPLPADARPTLADQASSLPAGLTYALAVLRPYRELPIDRVELERAWKILAGDTPLPVIEDYTIVVGQIGEPPHFIRSNQRPFRATTALGGLNIDVRMESWLPTDTIRRSGFGHVIVNRRHMLAIDRGVSLVVVGSSGPPLLTEHRAGLFAPVQRWVFGADDTVNAPCYR
jgi:hypothetical protein